MAMPIQLAAAALNQTPLDWSGNARRIQDALNEAVDGGASFCGLPELCITGYGCEDAFFMPHVQARALAVLKELATTAPPNLVFCVGLPVALRRALFNAVAVVADRQIVGFAAKRFLANDGVHYEGRWFRPWPEGVRTELPLGPGRCAPIGDLIFNLGGVRFGFEICEDAWVASRPGRELSRRGVDVIVNPSASHFAFGKAQIRERFICEGSRAFHACYVYANLVGNESGRIIFDGGCYIAQDGHLIAQSPRLTLNEVEVCRAVVDIELSRTRHRIGASGVPDLQSGDNEVSQAFDWPVAPQPLASEDAQTVESFSTFEAFTRAGLLALFDYLRKSRTHGFVVSLSGGCDSAAVAALVHYLVKACNANVRAREKLQHLPDAYWTAEGDLCPSLLTCVYQRSANSGETTAQAARELAYAIGCAFFEIDIAPVVEAYTALIEGATGSSLNWSEHDIVLQNIQARVRSPSIWMFANLRNALLLSTSNRSEAAIGYTTMDGDTSGCLAPVAGVSKTFLRKWLRWIEREGPSGLGPLPALGRVNAQQPTAELRPPAQGQTDETDLMPYPVLDAIEQMFIRDKYAPEDIMRYLATVDADLAPLWTRRFFQMWSRNQWKRERLAISFHFDDENLDPRSWCRFPPLSGGFQDELAELS